LILPRTLGIESVEAFDWVAVFLVTVENNESPFDSKKD